MLKKPFDLDFALADLRNETASPEARLRTRRALAAPLRRTWRLAAVTGMATILLLPTVLRTHGSEAVAITPEAIAQASLTTPYVFVTDYVLEVDGSRTLSGQTRLGPKRTVERLFFREDGQSGREIRHLPGFVFERLVPPALETSRGWKPYETLRRSLEPVAGTEEKTYSLFDDLRAVMSKGYRLERLPGETPQPGGRTWVQYRMRATAGPSRFDGTWTVELPSRRLIRTDTGRFDDGSGRSKTLVREYTYPTMPDRELLDVPKRGALPRFNLDEERATMDRLNKVGDRTAVVNGERVKLVGVFQEICAPGQPLYVAYEGKGMAQVKGLRGGGLTTMKSIPPKVVATVFSPAKTLTTLDVEIPVEGGGYATFKGVRVRPVSVEIRSGLRTPPFQ